MDFFKSNFRHNSEAGQKGAKSGGSSIFSKMTIKGPAKEKNKEKQERFAPQTENNLNYSSQADDDKKTEKVEMEMDRKGSEKY